MCSCLSCCARGHFTCRSVLTYIGLVTSHNILTWNTHILHAADFLFSTWQNPFQKIPYVWLNCRRKIECRETGYWEVLIRVHGPLRMCFLPRQTVLQELHHCHANFVWIFTRTIAPLSPPTMDSYAVILADHTHQCDELRVIHLSHSQDCNSANSVVNRIHVYETVFGPSAMWKTDKKFISLCWPVSSFF